MLRDGNSSSATGRTLNLGEGGIAISSIDEVHLSDSVTVECLLPDHGVRVQARSLVRYRGSSHSGLEFQDLSPYLQATVHEWTRKQLRRGEKSAHRKCTW